MKNDIVGRRYKKKGEVREEVKKNVLPHKKKRDDEIGGHRGLSELMDGPNVV